MKKEWYFLFMASTLISCSDNKKSDSPIAIFEASVDKVRSMETCIYPVQIERIGDYLVILDLGNKSQCLAAYSLEGDLIYRFGNKGNAEDEVNEVSHFFKIDDNKLSVRKPGGILYYDLSDLTDSICNHAYIDVKGLPISVHDICADSSGIISLSNSDDERFSYTDINSGETFTYNTYPAEFVGETDFQQAVFNYAPKFCVDMKEKRFCIGTYIGGILETFAITSEGIEPSGINRMFSSKFTKFDNGAVSWNKDSCIGFYNISADGDHIYTLLSRASGEHLINGDEDSFTDKISVFDWEANLHSEIIIGHNMISMCVSEARKEIYAICFKQSEGFYLIHASWQTENA